MWKNIVKTLEKGNYQGQIKIRRKKKLIEKLKNLTEEKPFAKCKNLFTVDAKEFTERVNHTSNQFSPVFTWRSYWCSYRFHSGLYCIGSQEEVQTAYFNITQSHFAHRCYVLQTLKFLDAQEHDFCLWHDANLYLSGTHWTNKNDQGNVV